MTLKRRVITATIAMLVALAGIAVAHAFELRTVNLRLNSGANCKFYLKYPKIYGLQDKEIEQYLNKIIREEGVNERQRLNWYRKFTANWRLCESSKFRAEYIQNYLLDYSSESYLSVSFYVRFDSNNNTRFYQNHINFSLKLGRQVEIADFFQGDFLPHLNSVILNKLNAVEKTHDFTGFKAEELHEVSFSATRFALRIHLKRGEVGHNSKPHVVTIPWSEVAGFISEREEETPFPL